MKKFALLSVWLMVTSIASADHLICWVTNGVAVYQIGAPDGWDGGIYDEVSHQWTSSPAPGWITIESVSFLETGPVDLSVPETLPWNHGGAIGCVGSSQVRNIASEAFKGLSSLRSLVVPDCVETIGYAAFGQCSSLESLTLPFVGTSRNEPINDENSNAFWLLGDYGGCTLRFCYVFGTQGYTNAYGVFYRLRLNAPDDYCYLPKSLRSVSITGETRIDPYSFEGCSGLESLSISGSATNIGHSAFLDCSGLTSVTIPDSVTSIESYAFEGCSGLTSITIPDNVTNIGYRAFYGCSSLTAITIPDGMMKIGGSAFEECSGLTSISILDNLKIIGARSFYNCSNLTEVVVPNSVTNIGNGAFSNCYNLHSLSLPYCGWTFQDILSCMSGWGSRSVSRPDRTRKYFPGPLTNITISVFSASSIPDYAFWGFGQYVTFPENASLVGLNQIGAYAFYECVNLDSFSIPEGVTDIGTYAFYGCSGMTVLSLPSSVTNLGYRAFFECNGLEDVSIRSVSSLNAFSFQNNTNLVSVEIGGIIKTIPDRKFQGCSSLSSVSIGSSVTKVGTSAFNGCSSLSAIALPDGMTTIGASAFANCSSLSSVSIPDSVMTVMEYAFRGCSDELFDVLTIPGVRLVDGWIVGFEPNLSGEVVLPPVRGIAAASFLNCSELTSITIQRGMKNIGTSLFQGCSGLETVEIPNSITNIGNYAFSSCTGLSGLTIPESVENIGSFAFNWCTNLVDIEITDGPKNIGTSAFYCCSRLKTVLIPNSVTNIEDGAFIGCSGLETLYLPPSFEGRTANLSIPETCEVVFYTKTSLIFETASLPGVQEGTQFQFQLSASGGLPPYRWTAVGLPDGLSLSLNGLLSGIPQENGEYNVVFSVRDLLGQSVSSNLVCSVELRPLMVLSSRLPIAVSGQPYSTEVSATGGRLPYVWTVSGLPAGLSASVEGTISGMPEMVGTNDVSITVEDSFGHVVSTQMMLTVLSPLRIIEDELPCATVGTPYSFRLRAVGGWEPYAWNVSAAPFPALPTWLSLSEGGILSGTPNEACSNSIGVVVVSADGQTTPGVFTLVVKTPPLVIETASLPDAQLYSSYNHGGMQMSASGGTPPYQWSANGLPDGLELTAEGRLWGFPQEYGEFDIEFSVRDSLGNSVSSNLVCTVNLPPLRIQTWSVPIADAGQPYSTRCLSADGGLPPYVWTVSGLPAGLSASADGRVSGTTEMVGTHDISVVVADSLGHSASCDLELSVCDPDDRKVIYVDASSTAPDPDGRSWATAYADLQTAAGALSNGRNLILVAPGRYLIQTLGLSLDENTELVSTGGSSRTIIDINWSYDYGIGGFRRIDGFTICNSCFIWPDDPDAVVENCIITNCMWDSTAVVFPCILRNSLVSGNNWSDWSYWSPIVEGSRIENCTFVGNVAPLAVDCVFLNSILWNSFDQDGNPVGPQDCFENCTFTNCLVQGWNADMEGSGSFDADPLFVDPAAGDFRLQSGSPCIDAALAGIAVWTNDLAGLARVSGRAVDLGAYEFQFASGETRTTPVPVPFEWMDEFPAMLADHGGDYETFGNATASNGVNKVWECYVAGLSPTNAAARFVARVEFENGKPVVTWTPDLGAARDYVVEGKETLGDGWGPTNTASRFFRVKVSLPE